MPSCHSTNQLTAELLRQKNLKEGAVIYTGFQNAGRGQLGTTWSSEPDRNVLMSLVLEPKFLRVTEQFLLSQVVSLAVKDCLQSYHDGDWKIKWPNDIYFGQKKIAGILIENNVQSDSLSHAIVGVGINVNQLDFDYPQADSLANISGLPHEVDEVIENLLVQIEKWYLKLRSGHQEEIRSAYQLALKGWGTLATWEDRQGLFKGKVVGVEAGGKLLIELSTGSIRSYGIKEVQMVFLDAI
jgi:BirA family biotin operon repressor/biotin-[acetyl-CoA-carboxylase] ligase